MTEPRRPHRHAGWDAAPVSGRRWFAIAGIAGVMAAAAIASAMEGGVGAVFGGDSGAIAAEPSDQPIVVTQNKLKREPRPTCGPREVGRRLRGFSEALATVDADALRSFWGRGFEWFVINLDHRGVDVRSFKEGLALVEKRGGLRLRFKEVKVDGSGGGAFDAVFWKRSSARSRTPLGGKLQLSCRWPTIIALTGFRHGRGSVAECPKPKSSVPRNAMILCTAR